MNGALLGLAILLLVTMFAGMLRIIRGPTPPDRMLASMLFGTTGVAVLLLLSEALEVAALVDVSLVFALLAAMAAIAFVQRAWRPVEAVARVSRPAHAQPGQGPGHEPDHAPADTAREARAAEPEGEHP